MNLPKIHHFNAPNRFGIQKCKHCGVHRRTVMTTDGDTDTLGTTMLLYQDSPWTALWSDFNPGCLGHYKRPLRVEIVDPTERERATRIRSNVQSLAFVGTGPQVSDKQP